MSIRLLNALLVFALLAGCGSQPDSMQAEKTALATTRPSGEAMLFEGMGSHHRPITTSSQMAQRYFDQGLTWVFAFNHGEALRSFRAALEQDPDCGMAWWGIALANGPHINNPAMTAQNYKDAWNAIQRATALKSKATPIEQALIAAIAKRYAPTPPSDRRPLDEAYAAAMADVYKKFPADTDVGTLYAESLMDLQPWDLWTKDGKPKGQTPTILAVLEDVIKRNGQHPGALHYYIHSVEASPNPQKGLTAAERLGNLVPDAGHLRHMPAHIYARTGKWPAASDANQNAIEADNRYRAVRPRPGFWALYMMHNHHFLSWSAMMEGRREVAVDAAREAVRRVPQEWARQNAALIDGYMAIVPEALIRFGMWDQILAEPAPPSYLPISTALWHFARATAHAAKNQLNEAEDERTKFEQAAAKIPPDALMAINPAKNVLQIARHTLAGEMAFRRGDIDKSVQELKKAIAIEDQLLYMEPPDWVQPVRHTLGAILVDAKRHAEAEQVFREDLKRWPENGWALFGLAQTLHAQGKHDEAAAADKRFAAAWKRADFKPKATCACVE